MSYYIGGIPPPDKMDRPQPGTYYTGQTAQYSPNQQAQLAAMAARGQPAYIQGSSPYPIPAGIPSVTLPYSSGGATAQYPDPRIGYAAAVMQPSRMGNLPGQMPQYPTHQQVGSYSSVGTIPTVTSPHPMYSSGQAVYGRPGAYISSAASAGQLPVSTHGYSPIPAHSPLYAPGSSYATMPTSTVPGYPYTSLSQMGYPSTGSPHAMPGAPAYPGASLFGPHYT